MSIPGWVRGVWRNIPQRGRVVRTPDLKPGDPEFKSHSTSYQLDF